MFRDWLLASSLVLSLCLDSAIGAAVSMPISVLTTTPVQIPTTTANSILVAPTLDAQAQLSQLALLKPVAAPSTIPQAKAVISTIAQKYANSTDIYGRVASLIQNGFYGDSIFDLTTSMISGDNSAQNILNPFPKTSIYPKALASDAPYSSLELTLRAAIRIPSTFTYGKKPPVILFPGTGSTGYITHMGNYIPLLSNVDYADPVWVNVPGYLLGDAQLNAEFAAYAINYISSLTSRNVSVIAWSQGNLDVQWSLKYWPSTRSKVSDFISISPDFHGTQLAYLLCNGVTNGVACPPAVIQQTWNSKFITTLRANGGDSAYVPTTTVYSSTDEVVQPQSGPSASAFLLDTRGVGVSNTLIQDVCGALPAGGLITHEGALSNALAVALAMDALKNPGPGSLSRIDTKSVCLEPIAPVLDLDDFLATEGSAVVALLSVLVYVPKVFVEPVIKAYAAKG